MGYPVCIPDVEKPTRNRILAAAIAAAICASASGARAAETESIEPVALEEIVVQAQKREQSAQEVPIGLSVLSDRDLANAGVKDISDVTRQAPVLEVQSSVSPVMTSFRLRRVGNLGNIPTFEPAVGLFIDGAFRSRAIFGATDLFDLERIEILRGPQSTLYGKNTTAGVIGIYTAAPSREFGANAEASVGSIEGGDGNVNSYQVKGGLTGPLTDTLRASFGASYTNSGPIMGEALANSGSPANDTKRYSVRGQLSWDLTDALNVRLIAGATNENDKKETSDITYDPTGPFYNIVLPAFRAAGISDTCSDNDPHDRITCVAKPLTTDLKAQEATLLARYNFENNWVLNSISSWDHFLFKGTMDDVAQMQAPLLMFHDLQENTSWQQELRINSPGNQRVDWLAGAFYYQNRFSRGSKDTPAFIGDTFASNPVVAAVNQQLLKTPFPLPIATAGQVGYLDSHLNTDYVAAYGQATWNITKQFNVTGGVRWQDERKDGDLTQSVNVAGPSVISLLLSPAAVSANDLERSTHDVTWTITPEWRITDASMLYATAAHGFKSGGFNIGFGKLPINQREFADEDITHYEVGAKFEPSNRVRLALNVFRTQYDNYQDAAFVGGQFTVSNAEQALLKGAEFEGAWLMADRLTADFAASYADLVYTKNTRGQCYPGRVSNSTTTPGACDLSGEHPVNAPDWKTHLGLQYDQPLSWGSIFTRADWSWTSEYNTSFSADPRLKQDAYSWVNLRAGTRWKNYEFDVWSENVTNVTVANIDAVLTLYAGDGSYQSLLQAPRSFGATFKVKF